MAWFGRKKEFVDLGERYRRQEERANNIKSDMQSVKSVPVQESSASPFPFFGFGAVQNKIETPVSNSDSINLENSEEIKKRLAKRLSDMTNQIENLENQIYHLQQRVEVLERKSGV